MSKPGLVLTGQVLGEPRFFGENKESVAVMVYHGAKMNAEVVAWGREGKPANGYKELSALKAGQLVSCDVGVGVGKDGLVKFYFNEVLPASGSGI